MKKDTYMIENKNYLINESNLDSNRMLLYDKNKKLISVSENNSKGHFKKSINYYNNIPYQIEENNYKTISNNISEELDILSDEKLKPHPRFNFHPKANEIEGEKTFYSNGNIETNTFIQDGKEVKYHFLPNGKIKSVVLNNIIVENGKNKGISYYSIKEIFPDNAEKETTYFTNTNNALVKYTDNNTEKYINYSNNKIRTCHYRKNNNIYLYNFDNKGNLSNFQEITNGKTS
jgi:hypothetical protein